MFVYIRERKPTDRDDGRRLTGACSHFSRAPPQNIRKTKEFIVEREALVIRRIIIFNVGKRGTLDILSY